MEWLRGIVLCGLRWVDGCYRLLYRLRPAGEVLYVGRSRYRGAAMEFADGTQLTPGDYIGTLHFNNARFTQLDGASNRRAALQFAHLMLESLQVLAHKARHDPAFSDLAVYHALSWLPPHGERIGFVTRPYPHGVARRLHAAYFRLLVWAYAPASKTRASARPEPTLYWITRRQLLRQFADAEPISCTE